MAITVKRKAGIHIFKINDSKVGFGGTKLCLGKFRLALQTITGKVSTNQSLGTQGDNMAILEFNIKEIYSQQAISETQPDGKKLTIKENQPGQRVGFSWNMKKAASGGNLISFCAAYLGIDNPQDSGEIDEAREAGADWDKILAELMGIDANGKPTGKTPGLDHEFIVESKLKQQAKGFSFVVYDFYPVGSKASGVEVKAA